MSTYSMYTEDYILHRRFIDKVSFSIHSLILGRKVKLQMSSRLKLLLEIRRNKVSSVIGFRLGKLSVGSPVGL